MQDRYAGDIGDFGKFHLLRNLFQNGNEIIYQIWYTYPNENHNNDGIHINYFQKVKDNDIYLEEKLFYIANNNRNIKALEDAKLLNNAKFFSKLVVNDNQKDLEYRLSWLKEALSFSKGASIIAVDPDNGIANRCIKTPSKDLELLGFDEFKNKSKAGKYIFTQEIESFYKIKTLKLLIVYHHLNRCTTHDNQILIIKTKLEEKYHKVIAVKHKPYSPRVYFFIFKDEDMYIELKKKIEFFSSTYPTFWHCFY